ncbi:hypothetical protein [Desulfobulbus oligotrophicus]|uniref:Uncharacterized protein n=1 Tax=Desulfobulbus oligotrophicus TaxID=1909699 RepID=A0A7T5VDS2_9BACT|nr:hypothetical protein [Desulfobulbus oligotrophicus]MDY0389305.1 hypothetical protein [Desulfobulbus oligotrophicus]QQG66044.1 hypothetical protein HP555_09265 [Desulfobulbus oligotrophicus]
MSSLPHLFLTPEFPGIDITGAVRIIVPFPGILINDCSALTILSHDRQGF